ncbi:hypothetical protein B0H67DRAFT_566483 [Lasiosphaeris hirsuta]|uniref:Uncharacterized protein n=1 Tax=Lasiosphaeris hirsuta TaxID=260670 RepID=A0AA40E9R0_9PEZI|nr:hypothetical protein B0H67DRAFT_566483 [Lasiosphaeris hirsuta]
MAQARHQHYGACYAVGRRLRQARCYAYHRECNWKRPRRAARGHQPQHSIGDIGRDTCLHH